MGCDIHCYVEAKENGKWVAVEAMKLDENGNMDVPYPQKIYTGRNYFLFGFLTEGKVRNDGGVYAGKLKGFPKDASSVVKVIYERRGTDAHTPNYITLKELQDVNWERKIEDEDANGNVKLISLKQALEQFYWDVIMRMDFYAVMKHNSDEIRLVFWFDN